MIEDEDEDDSQRVIMERLPAWPLIFEGINVKLKNKSTLGSFRNN